MSVKLQTQAVAGRSSKYNPMILRVSKCHTGKLGDQGELSILQGCLHTSEMGVTMGPINRLSSLHGRVKISGSHLNLPGLSYQDRYGYSLCEPPEFCLWKDSFYRVLHIESGPVRWLVREQATLRVQGQIRVF